MTQCAEARGGRLGRSDAVQFRGAGHVEGHAIKVDGGITVVGGVSVRPSASRSGIGVGFH